MMDEFRCSSQRIEKYLTIYDYLASRDADGLAELIWNDTHRRNVFASYDGTSGDHALAIIKAASRLPQ
jgi:hypothetical protein